MRCPYARFDLGLGRLSGICCRVTLGSAFLWRFGYRQAWARVARLIHSWTAAQDAGGEVWFQVSKLHLCADVAGLAVDELQREEFVHRRAGASWHASDAQLLDLVPQEPNGSGRRATTAAGAPALPPEWPLVECR